MNLCIYMVMTYLLSKDCGSKSVRSAHKELEKFQKMTEKNRLVLHVSCVFCGSTSGFGMYRLIASYIMRDEVVNGGF